MGLPVSTQAQAVAPASAAAPASIGPNDVVARLISFDRNRDGKVEAIELVERMRGLVASGDGDDDGALDRGEIALMVNRHPARSAGAVLQMGPYRFGDEDGSSPRSHFEGAFEDLRLANGTRERALPLVDAFLDARDASVRASFVREMESVLKADQLRDFKAAIEQPGRIEAFFALLTPRGIRGTCSGSSTSIFCNPTVLTITSPGGSSDAAAASNASFTLPPIETLAAVQRVQALLRPSDVERSELLEQLNGILSDEERDNFRAALERRPLVAPPLFIDVTAR
jgi:hypothetical protein